MTLNPFEFIQSELGLPDGFMTRILFQESDPWTLCLQCHSLVEAASTEALCRRLGVASNSREGKAVQRIAYSTKIRIVFGQSDVSGDRFIPLLPGLEALGELRNERAHNPRTVHKPLAGQTANRIGAAIAAWLRIDFDAAVQTSDDEARARLHVRTIALYGVTAAFHNEFIAAAEQSRRVVEALRILELDSPDSETGAPLPNSPPL